MKQLVWDTETNGLLDELTKIHVIAWQEVGSSEEGPAGKMRFNSDTFTLKEVV